MIEHKDFSTCHAWRSIAIRAFCIQCMGYQVAEIEKCTVPKCPLFPYRMGRKPKEGSELVKELKKVLKISKRSNTQSKSDNKTEVCG